MDIQFLCFLNGYTQERERAIMVRLKFQKGCVFDYAFFFLLWLSFKYIQWIFNLQFTLHPFL